MRLDSIRNLCLWLNLPDKSLTKMPDWYSAKERAEFDFKFDEAFGEYLQNPNYAHLIDKRTQTRKRVKATLRERKYLVKCNAFKYWSSELANLEGQEVEIIGFFNSSVDRWSRSTLKTYDKTEEKFEGSNTYTLWVAEVGEEISADRRSRIDDGSKRWCIPLEYLEEFYKEAYEIHPQFWICDGSGELIEGHRWEVPIATISGQRGGRYSESYLEQHCKTCSDCGELFWRRDLKWWKPEGSDEAIATCNSCLTKRGIRFCVECGEVIESDSLFINYCNEHGNQGIQRAMNKEYINDYHNFDYFKKYLLPEDDKDSLLLGVELEVDQDDCEDRPQYDTLLELRQLKCVADFQNDGSLEGGFEMITHPCTHGYHKRHLSAVVKELLWNWNDEEYSDNCGVHIHVGRKQLDEEIFRRVDYFMHKHQRNITKIANRRSDRWSRFAKDIGEDDWENFGHQHDDRYEAMNFRNEHTVEFRIFAQPRDFKEMMTYIDFVDAICMFNKLTTRSQVAGTTSAVSWELFKFYVNEHRGKYSNLCKHSELLTS